MADETQPDSVAADEVDERRRQQGRQFVETVADLRSRTRLTATNYDLIQAAGLLRRLLLDKKPLGPCTGKAFDIKAKFRWFDTHVPFPGFSILWPTFDPDIAPETLASRGLSREFLNHFTRAPFEGNHHALIAVKAFEELAEHGGSKTDRATVTVGELISQIANDEGGVHFDMGEFERKNVVLGGALRSYETCALGALLAVGRVVVRGYEPLSARIVFSDPYYGRVLPPVGFDGGGHGGQR